MDHRKDIVNYRLSETLISMIKSPTFLVKLDDEKHPHELITCNKEALQYFNLNPYKTDGTLISDLKMRDFNMVPWKDICGIQSGDVLCYSTEGLGSKGFTRYFQVSLRPSFLDKKRYAFVALFDITRDVTKDNALMIQQQMQKVIGSLLKLTSLDMSLEVLLDRILDQIVTVNWESIEDKGCIFIYDQGSQRLVMRAQRNIGDDLLTLCKEVPLGKCLCGIAAEKKEIYFTNHIDKNHTTAPEGMLEHGHCCVPILSNENEIMGVLNLYIKHNHSFNDEETAFLQAVAGVIAIVVRYKVEHNANEELKKQMVMTGKMASLGELAAGVAHEINNPLMVIKGNLERLKEAFSGCKTDQCKENKEIIDAQERSIETIISIASGLKGYARFKESTDRPIDLHQIINETINLIRFIYKRDGINFNIELEATDSFVVSTYVKMQQVLMNLFSNARDAMSMTKIKIITVQTKNREGQLLLKIADTGHGIKKENREKVFEKYFTTKEIGKGTGLGMGIVRSILDSMGAKVNLGSKLGVGTIFSFAFPIAVGLKTKVEDKVEVKETKLNGKVLVVDDSPELLEIFNFYLTKMGLDVVKTKSPINALQILDSDHFDYLITDLKMDEMGGTELAHEVRACGLKTIRIILVSADIEALNKLNESKKAHDAFLPKPFNKDQLFEVLISLKD